MRTAEYSTASNSSHIKGSRKTSKVNLARALWGCSPDLQDGDITTHRAAINESQKRTVATVAAPQNGNRKSGATANNAKCAAAE